MAQTAPLRLDALQREVRFSLPFDARLAVLVNEAQDMPDLEERRMTAIVLKPEKDLEVGAGDVVALIEQFRDEGVGYLLVPGDVYPWLERQADAGAYIRGNFRRVPADESACQIFALQSLDPDTPTVAEDGLPIPPIEMTCLVAGGLQPAAWFADGRSAVSWIVEMLQRNGADPQELGSLLDFGCGCGRVIRHWPSVTDAKLFGSDYNPHLIGWCRENLPAGEFEVNGLEPPLPFENDTFDFLYALSLFTHLDETLQVPWMDEVTRVVKPGGLFLLTFHGQSRFEDFAAYGREDVIRSFEAGELVVIRGEHSGGNGCATWHPESYVLDQLARNVEVVDYSPGGALDIGQDAVLFRKPLEAPPG